MGGTTFLAGLIVDGEPVATTSTVLNQYPINVPMVGVAHHRCRRRRDRVGGQRRQPARRPAQRRARPGPACYGDGGTEPTDTDVDLLLGIVNPSTTSSGAASSCPRSSPPRPSRTHIAKPLGLSVDDAARRSTPCRTPRPPTWCARSSSAGPRPPRLRALRLRRRRPDALRQLRRGAGGQRGRGPAGPDRLGVLRLRPGGLRHRADRRALHADQLPARAGRVQRCVRASCERAGGPARPRSGCASPTSNAAARSTCATRCSSPRSPPRCRTGRLDAAAIEAIAAAFEQRYEQLYGKGPGFAEAGHAG